MFELAGFFRQNWRWHHLHTTRQQVGDMDQAAGSTSHVVLGAVPMAEQRIPNVGPFQVNAN